jgi:hypothetical protein
MIGPTRPPTRRGFILSLLAAPAGCAGCGADSAVVDTKVGGRRSRKMEDLKTKADLRRQATKKARPR